jgi:prevent-host-death family protein
MMRSLGASEARNNLAEVLEQVHYGQERVTIERRGKPFAVLVPIEDLELLQSGEIERLRESEARLRSIMEHAPVAIYLKDTEGRYLEANRHYKETWGIADAEVRGKLPSEFYEDQDFARAGRSHDLAVLESSRAIEQEDSTELDGGPCTFRVIKFPVRDDAGEVTGLGAITLDITEHKKAEEEVRKAHSLFEETERLARLGHWEWDEVEDRCTYCSEELARLHGVSVEEYLARATSQEADLEWVHPEDRDRVSRVIEQTKGAGFEIEYRLLCEDGSILEVREVSNPFLDENGALARTVGFMQDITERKQAERALRSSEARFRDFADASSDWFWEMDEECRFSYFSDRFTDVTGVPQEDLLGKTRGETGIPGAGTEALGKHLSDLAAHRSFRDFQHPRTHPDGHLVTLAINGKAVFDEAGNFRGYRGTGTDVTERKRAEDELRRTQSLFEEAERLAKLGHWEWDDVEDRCLYCSEELARLYGVSVDDYLDRMTFWEGDLSWVHPDDRERVERAAREARKECAGFNIEYRIMRDDGEVREVREVAVPHLAKDGSLFRSVGFVQDITEHKQAEQALRESESALARAQRQARIGSWRWSVERNALISSSEEYARIHGVDRSGIEDLLAHQMERVIHPGDRARVEAEFKRFDEEGLDYEIEYRIVRSDGEVRHVIEIGEAILDETGRAVEQTGTVQDITERKRAEEALRESQALLEQAAVMARLGHWVWDEVEDRCIHCSETLARMNGTTVEEYLARLGTMDELTPVIHPDDRQRYEELIAKAKETVQSYDIEFRYRIADGEYRYLRERGEPVVDESGRLVRTVGTLQDITDYKRAEEELKRARDELEQRVEERTVELRWVNVALTREIAERKQAEEETERSRELLHSAVEALDEGFVIFDAEDRLVLCNGKFRTIYWPASAGWSPGVPMAQVARDTARTCIGLSAEDDIEAWVRDRLEQHRQLGLHFDQTFADGRWIQAAQYPLPNGWTVGTRIDISEIKRAEQELRGSEAQLKQAQTMARIGTFVWDDVTGRCAFCSEELAHLLQMTVEEFMDKRGRHDDLLSTIHPDDRERYQKVIEIANESLEPYDVEYRVYDNEEHLRHCREMGRPQLDHSGRLAHTFGTVQDITDIRRAEEALRESEDRLRQATELAGLGYSIWNPIEDKCLYCSEEFARIYGTTAEDYMARASTMEGDWSFTHPDDRRLYKAAIEKVRRGAGAELEYRVVTPSGETRHVKEVVKPVFDEAGVIVQEYSTVQDITAIKKAEDELRESERRYRELFEESPVAIWEEDWSPIKQMLDGLAQSGVKDWRGYFSDRRDLLETAYDSARITEISLATMDIYRAASLEELARMSATEFAADEELDAFRETILAFLAGQMSVDIEARDKACDESEIMIRRRVVIPPKYHDDWSRVIYAIEDITERTRVEEQLRQAQKMEAVGQLTGGVAHDFNNLLAVIVGNAEFLEDQLGKDDQVVQGIMQAVTRGAELTERLLAFSRRQPLNPQPTDLGALVENMTGLMKRTLGVTIEIETARTPDLRSALADPGQVENAVLNLAINARDAMPDGGKLLIEAHNTTLNDDASSQLEIPSGNYVVLAVSDTGTGMTPEVLEHVFEPFFTTKDVGEGSGLGLSMVYGFAKQSGGCVTIYSEPGRGTTVKLYLPRAEDATGQAREEARSDMPPGRGEMILIVEDDPDVRTLAGKMLEGLGYRVTAAADAAAGLAALEDAPEVDLLLSDMILPGVMGGPDFANTARTRQPTLKVLFMSGYTGSTVFQHGLQAEAAEVLQKPFRKLELAQRVREMLDG